MEPDLTNGPWRVLVLDRDPEDPKWIIATVTMAADVRPAVLDAAGRYTGWLAVTEWVAAMVGRPSRARCPCTTRWPGAWTRASGRGEPRGQS